MSNKLHENNQTSPENNNNDDTNDNTNAIGLDEGSMKVIVIVLGLILFLGFVGVVGTIVYRIVNLSPQEVELNQNIPTVGFEVNETQTMIAIGNIEVEKPVSSKLKTFQINQGLIYLHFENSTGVDNIKIIRLSDGMVMGGIGFLPSK